MNHGGTDEDTMIALRFKSYGRPSALALEEMPVPVPNEGEVLVEVYASGINPSDVKFVAGLMNSSLPMVPGRDFAGVVVAGDVRMGRAVWGSGAGFGVTRNGAHAQYVAIPSEWLSEKPSNLSMEQAAAVGVPYVTAWSALVDVGKIRPSETVLVTGASGAVGRAAIQIARWKGAGVIGAARSNKASEADALVNTSIKDLSTEVKALTGGKGVDLAFDTVGGPVFESSLMSLGVGGRQLAIASTGERRVELDLVDFYRGRKRLIGVDTATLSGADVAGIMIELRRGFEEGRLRAPAVKTWPLAQGVDAYTVVEAGYTSAKQVLLPCASGRAQEHTREQA